MVDHLTRVTIDIGAPRAEALAVALAALGFEVRRERRRIVANSFSIGPHEVKEQLGNRGFQDREFQIFLEYVRQWGFL